MNKNVTDNFATIANKTMKINIVKREDNLPPLPSVLKELNQGELFVTKRDYERHQEQQEDGDVTPYHVEDVAMLLDNDNEGNLITAYLSSGTYRELPVTTKVYRLRGSILMEPDIF